MAPVKRAWRRRKRVWCHVMLVLHRKITLAIFCSFQYFQLTICKIQLAFTKFFHLISNPYGNYTAYIYSSPLILYYDISNTPTWLRFPQVVCVWCLPSSPCTLGEDDISSIPTWLRFPHVVCVWCLPSSPCTLGEDDISNTPTWLRFPHVVCVWCLPSSPCTLGEDDISSTPTWLRGDSPRLSSCTLRGRGRGGMSGGGLPPRLPWEELLIWGSSEEGSVEEKNSDF